MPQPTTYLIDLTEPNEQSWPWSQPIFWTLNRTYAFNQQVASVSVNKALWYLSLDGGKTWSKPDAANAQVCNGESDFYFDGSTHLVNMLILPLSFGLQHIVLQDFDFDTSTYSAVYGNVAGVPTHNDFADTPRICRMADGSLMCFYATSTAGLQRTVWFAVFSAGAWTVTETQVSTNIALGNFAQIETIIPDPANNLCHVFYSDGGLFGTLTVYYRQITSGGVLGAITTLSAGFNLHIGFLNKNKGLGSGYLDTAFGVGGSLVVPVTTQDPITNLKSIAVVRGTPTSAPVFTISATIDTSASTIEGWDPVPGIVYHVGTVQHLLYFMGDGLGNLYNLVKHAINSGGGWTTSTYYDATVDPNAGKNTGNNQWINAISGAQDPAGGPQFQIATWLTIAPEAFQNTATLTTAFTAAPPPPPVQPSTWKITDGGGGGWECRVYGCLPKPQHCPDWGPVSLVRRRGVFCGIYRDSRGNIHEFSVDPNLDAVNQLAAAVIRYERGNVNPRANNPGRLPAAPGQIAEVDGVAVLPDLQSGIEALRQAVLAGLLQSRREVI